MGLVGDEQPGGLVNMKLERKRRQEEQSRIRAEQIFLLKGYFFLEITSFKLGPDTAKC